MVGDILLMLPSSCSHMIGPFITKLAVHGIYLNTYVTLPIMAEIIKLFLGG
jgi:hypothetical protein